MIIHYLSASRLKTYLQCTEKYHQAYENKVRSDAVHLRFGTMMHTVFERWFQEEKDILEIYEEEWRKSDVVDPEYYKDGLDIAERFAEDNDRDNTTSLGFEQVFAIDIANDIVVDTSKIDFSDLKQMRAFLKKLEEDDTPYIYGFIDRIDYDVEKDVLRIVDYKTSRVAISKDESDKDEQLSMYALVASYLYPEYENVELILDYVRLGERVRTTRTELELDIFKDWLIGMYYIIKNDVSPVATVNKFCGFCDSRKNCTGYQEVIKGEADDTEIQELDYEELDGELEKINTHIKILTGRKKEIEEAFKEKLKETDNAPIQVGDSKRYVTNNMRMSYDVNTVISLFPENYESLVSVKKSDVDKLAKGNTEALKALDETAEKYFISPTLRKKKG